MYALSLEPCPPPAVTGRFLALTMPSVTVPDSPSGEPIASTGSPTTTLSELPSGSAGRFLAFTSQHRDVIARGLAERPSPTVERPLLKVTSTSPWASATTWLFVTMTPVSSMTNPEPVACPFEVSTLICTTLGSTRAATPGMLPAGRSTSRAGAAPRLAPSTVPEPVSRSASRKPAEPAGDPRHQRDRAPPARPAGRSGCRAAWSGGFGVPERVGGAPSGRRRRGVVGRRGRRRSRRRLGVPVHHGVG